MALSRYILVAFLAWIAYYLAYDYWYADVDPALLQGKNVLITGASSGIGEQMAYVYAKSGANVFVTARREDRLRQVMEECRKLGPSSAKQGYLAADMGKADDRAKLVQTALSFFSNKLDHFVINHAWFPADQVAWDGSEENLQRLRHAMEINFFAYVHLTGLTYPTLAKSEGYLAIVSSSGGRVSVAHNLEYGSSKFALDGYYSNMRKELNVKGSGKVSITTAFLGYIDTEAARDFLQGQRKMVSDSYLIDFVQNYLGARPDDTAKAFIGSIVRRENEFIYPKKQFLGLAFVLRHMGIDIV